MKFRPLGSRLPGMALGPVLTALGLMLVLGSAAHVHHAFPDVTPCHACVHGKAPAPSLEPTAPRPLPQPARLAVPEAFEDPATAPRRSGRTTRAPPVA